jgi:hypothetical protein
MFQGDRSKLQRQLLSTIARVTTRYEDSFDVSWHNPVTQEVPDAPDLSVDIFLGDKPEKSARELFEAIKRDLEVSKLPRGSKLHIGLYSPYFDQSDSFEQP